METCFYETIFSTEIIICSKSIVFDRFLHEWCENHEKMCLKVEFSVTYILFMENMSSTNSTCNGAIQFLANPNFARFEDRADFTIFMIFWIFKKIAKIQRNFKMSKN